MSPFVGVVFSLLFSICVCAQEKDTQSIDTLRFDGAVKTAETMPRLYGILVSQQGDVILEKYFNGSSSDKLVNIKSASKSILSALVGIAISQGHISSLNQPIGDYFGEHLNNDSGRHKASITIENLITMQSGLESTSNRNYGAWVLSTDWVAFALNLEMEYPPGMLMRYSTGNTHMLSAILTKATGLTVLQYARENLTSSLGFRLAEWPRDPMGIYFGGNDMEMTARQMLKFGELYLNRGRANGKQVVPAKWINDSFQRHANSTREQGRYYGYGWWLREMAGYDTAYAWGYGGQFIILIPDLKLVVVTTSSSFPNRDRRSHRRELRMLLENHIIKPVADVLNTKSAGLD